MNIPLRCSLVAVVITLVASTGWAQDAAPATKKKKGPAPIDDSISQAPATLPGNGLAYRDFLYSPQAGQTIHLVKKGKIVWTYSIPGAPGEMQETTLLSNGHILFAHIYGAKEIDQDRNVVWSYEPPPKGEIHTIKAIGNDKIVFIQNGNPAQVMLATKSTKKVEPLFALPVGVPDGAHMQTRRADLTEAGTIIVAQTDLNKVVEYDASGKQIWSADVERPWSVQRLKNGNTLVCSFAVFVREIGPKGETVWEFTPKDMPGYVVTKWIVATRLKKGNTLISNSARWSPTANESNGPVQAIEVSPTKQIVWALRSWKDPALPSALTVQFLDEPGPQEHQHFGNIR